MLRRARRPTSTSSGWCTAVPPSMLKPRASAIACGSSSGSVIAASRTSLGAVPELRGGLAGGLDTERRLAGTPWSYQSDQSAATERLVHVVQVPVTADERRQAQRQIGDGPGRLSSGGHPRLGLLTGRVRVRYCRHPRPLSEGDRRVVAQHLLHHRPQLT